MTIANALSFIKRGLADSAFRKRLNSSSSYAELENVLADEKIMFSATDFDQAYHHQLTLCQEKEEADQLKEFKMWWDYLMQVIGVPTCSGTCGTCG